MMIKTKSDLHCQFLKLNFLFLFFFYISLGLSTPLGLSLSAPSGVLQQAFSRMKQARVERSSTIDPLLAEHEAIEAGLAPNSNTILAPPEAAASTASITFPGVTSTATSSPPPSTGRVSPPPASIQSLTPAPVPGDPSPPPQSAHEEAPSPLPPAANVASTIPSPSVQTSVPAGPGPHPSSGSVSSVVSVASSSTAPSTVPASEQQPVNASVHSAPHTTTQSQPQPVESEGAELSNKTGGRDAIQALDKKLRSLFKDQSSTSASVDQNTGTSSPPAGTSSPPPGLALVPPSNLALTTGTPAVPGLTTTPGQGINPPGQTPPTKPRAQVSEDCCRRDKDPERCWLTVDFNSFYILFSDFTYWF